MKHFWRLFSRSLSVVLLVHCAVKAEWNWTLFEAPFLGENVASGYEKVNNTIWLLAQTIMYLPLDTLQEKARAHKSGHSYGLEEYGLTEAGIRSAVPTVFERYAFD